MATCLSVNERRRLIEPGGSPSIVRQCELLDISRAAIYYEPKGETALNLELMRKIDEQYTKTPFYGSRKMTEWLRRRENYDVNRKRVQRLMRLMGIEAIYQKPRTSISDEQHKVYPYLLRDLSIQRPNQVWATDITYVPLRGGFVYLVAILDWFSRYVISWQLSNTLDRAFCLEALDAALEKGKPDIFNTDQGCQFTSADFTDRLKNANVLISMDGRGRCFDNIFTERLWRTVKYEDIYINDYDDVPAVYAGLNKYWNFYNTDRLHQSLGYKTPEEVHFAAAA